MLPTRTVRLLVLPFLACAGLWAQDGAVFRSDSRLVVLHATVQDSENHLVTDLPRGAFRVYENGAEQEIKIFRREDAAVSLGILVDDSSSMVTKRPRVASATLALVKASNPDDEVFIINFNEHTYLDADFTHDTHKLEEALNRLEPRGTTAMRDALRLGIAHVSNRGKEDKKVLLVITDGEDNSSGINLDDLVRQAQQSGVLIYTVGVMDGTSRDEARRARRDLDALAQATGGLAYYIDSLDQVGEVTRDIAHDVRNQYTIAYSPSDPSLDGTFRKLEVKVKDLSHPDVAVRARSGYYASPEASAKNSPPEKP